MADEIKYVPSYTGMQFHTVPMGYKFKGIRGPMGSGKSVACCWDIFYKSCDQVPLEVVEKGHKRRVRWSKWLIGRLTYPELVRTTIETWLQWFPQTNMVYSPEIEGRLELPHPENDGTLVRIDLEFFALNAKNIMNDLMSLEISGAWVNEATQVEWKKIDRIHDRLGRFQPVKSAKGVMLDSFGVIMDTNSPDESNWWRKMEEVTKPEGCVWLAQPPALLRREKDGRVWYEDNDGRDFKTRGIRPAENVEHLKEGFYYWHKMIGTKSEDDIRKLVLNEFGTSAGGKPVYPEYKDIVHNTKKTLPFHRGLSLLMGSDFGRTPCTVIAQMGDDGVLRVLDECVSDNMSAEQFIEEILRPKLMNKYGWPQIPHINFGDPAGMNKNEVVNISAIETFNNYHINTMPAPNTHGNDPIIRIDTVSELLRRGYNGNPAVLFSSNCDTLIKGFRGHYKYRKMRTSEDGDERFSEVPDKNMYSHIQDAFQYLCMGVFKSGIDYSRAMMGGRFGNRAQKVVFNYDFGC